MWAKVALACGLGWLAFAARAEPEQIVNSVFEPVGGIRVTEYLTVAGERRLEIMRPGAEIEIVRGAAEPFLVAHGPKQSLFFRIEVGPVKSVVWRQYPSREQAEFVGATGFYKDGGNVAIPIASGLMVIDQKTATQELIPAPFTVFSPNLVAAKIAGKWELRRWDNPVALASSETPFVAASPNAWLTSGQTLELPIGFAVDPSVTPVRSGERMMFGILREEAFGPGHVMSTASDAYSWRERVNRYMMLDDGFQIENGPWRNPLLGPNFAILEEPLERPWRGGAYRRKFWRVDLRTYDYVDLKQEGVSGGRAWRDAAWLRTSAGFTRIDLATGAVKSLGAAKDTPTKFVVNLSEMIAVARHEVYAISDSAATLISAPGTEFRYVATADAEIPTSQQLYVRVEREVGGQAGVGLVRGRRLELSDMSSTLVARRGLYGLDFLQQDFDQPPRVLNGGAVVATSNPEFERTNAGNRKSLTTTWRGHRLAASLLSPDGDPTPRPLVIYIYDRMAGRGFEFPLRDPRDPYSIRAWLDAGYHVLLPDLAFETGNPGSSVVGCLREWLKVLRTSSETKIKFDRVGLIGHSWGGYGALFAATQMPELRCVVAGAPITDLAALYYSSYGGGTEPNSAILEHEQGRMGTSPDKNPAAYRRNSPMTYLAKLRVPVLAAFGDKDELVTPAQHEMLYHALWEHRRGSVVVRYRNENHAISRPENRADYRQKIDSWFRHHLDGERAEGLGK